MHDASGWADPVQRISCHQEVAKSAVDGVPGNVLRAGRVEVPYFELAEERAVDHVDADLRLGARLKLGHHGVADREPAACRVLPEQVDYDVVGDAIAERADLKWDAQV